jgi:hypothetical protein
MYTAPSKAFLTKTGELKDKMGTLMYLTNMLCVGGIQLTSTRPSISTQTTKTSTTHHLQPQTTKHLPYHGLSLLIPTRGKTMKDKMALLNIAYVFVVCK